MFFNIARRNLFHSNLRWKQKHLGTEQSLNATDQQILIQTASNQRQKLGQM